jgi:hypothetical protein
VAPPRWRLTCSDDDRVPVSCCTRGAVGVAGEYQELTTVLAEGMSRPEIAQAELTACARMVRWRTATARPRQRCSGGDRGSAVVRNVKGNSRRGCGCTQLGSRW